MLKRGNSIEEIICKKDSFTSNFDISDRESSFLKDEIKIIKYNLENEKRINAFLSTQLQNISEQINGSKFNWINDPSHTQIKIVYNFCKILNKICQNGGEESSLRLKNLENLIKNFNFTQDTQYCHTQLTSLPTNDFPKRIDSKDTLEAGFSNFYHKNSLSNEIKNDYKFLVNSLFHIACEIYPLRHTIGKYDWEVRIKKIFKFKLKSIYFRKLKPVSRKYLGRSKIASLKLRNKGRFIKNGLRMKKKYFKIEN